VPEAIRILLKRGLEKDRAARLSDIGTVRFLMSGASALPAAPAARRPFRTVAIPAIVTALVVAALTSAAWWYVRPSPASPAITRFPLALPPGQAFSNAGRQVI